MHVSIIVVYIISHLNIHLLDQVKASLDNV